MDRLEQLVCQLKEKQSNKRGLTFLITGANSGIGLDAAKILAMMNPIHRIILACRNEKRANEAREQILPLLPKENADYYRENIIPIACDHSSFDSIREFNIVLRRKLNETYSKSKWLYNGIDVMCLNAAILMAKDADPEFTEDGLELTFQTNYLAPFLIANLTADLLNPGARVVVSTSGLHQFTDLKLNGMIQQDHDCGGYKVKKGFVMPDGSEYNHKHCYALSKLCVVSMCVELEKRLSSSKKGITVNCFSPGLMTKSGLFRHNRTYFHSNQAILKKEKLVEWGAGALVYMAIADETAERSCLYWRDADSELGWDSIYGKHFTSISIKKQIDKTTRECLWILSCQLVNISNDHIEDNQQQKNNC